MTCSSSTTSSTGRTVGTTTCTNRCQEPAPSISAASTTSSGTWVSAAYTVKTTKGTLIQTTMIVATAKNDIGSSSQECPSWSEPSEVSTELTTPYCVSKRNCHTIIAATTGVAQVSSSPPCTASRTQR